MSPTQTIPNIQSTSEVIIPAFILIPDVPHCTRNDTNNQHNITNQENIATLNLLVFSNNSGKLEMQSELLPLLVPIIKKPKDDLSELDNQKPQEAVNEQPASFLP
jgi:hypothetical protein